MSGLICRQPLDFYPVEEIHDEAAHLVHLLATVDAGAEMRIAGMPDGEDVETTRFEQLKGEMFRREALPARSGWFEAIARFADAAAVVRLDKC